MTNSSDAAFILTYNVAQLPDDSEVTFQLVQPEGLNPDDLWNLQEPPVFFSFAEPFDGVDYPINSQALPILSEKAFRIMEQLNPNHGCDVVRIKVINTVLDLAGDPRADLQEVADLIAASQGNPRYASDQFLALRLPALAGVFDTERSKYAADSDGRLDTIDEYVLNLKPADTPPLFVIPEHLGKVFITASLWREWQRQGVTGTAYYSLYSPWSDIMVDDGEVLLPDQSCSPG